MVRIVILFICVCIQAFSSYGTKTVAKLSILTDSCKKFMVAGLLVSSLSSNPLSAYAGIDDENFGDTSSSVGSIDFNIFRSQRSVEESKLKVQEKLMTIQSQSGIQGSENDFDKVLSLIPSWKYYKIISNEYSKRSTGYTGEPNLLAPLL